jgi:hypothetical protein
MARIPENQDFQPEDERRDVDEKETDHMKFSWKTASMIVTRT